MRLEAHTGADDLFGEPTLNQRALIELEDGRLVELTLDGRPEVVYWADQAELFKSIVESLRPAEPL